MPIFQCTKKVRPLDENTHIIYAIYIELLELRRLIKCSAAKTPAPVSYLVYASQIFREKAGRAKLLLISGANGKTMRNVVFKINELYDEIIDVINNAIDRPMNQ